jgi:hypothetical protein
LPSNNGNEIVDVSVGGTRALYRVPKQKLIKAVPRFADLLAGRLEIYLPDIGCEDFDLLIDFVDRGGVAIRPMYTAKKFVTELTTSWDPISFFSLVERLELPRLQNLIMDTIIQYHKKERRLLSPEFVYRVYQTTRQGSAISRYALRGVRFTLQIEKDADGSVTS